ncbi:MAG: HAD family phosphatase, partial [Chloroflexi bacterium]|nr:HAD family phosphatase [Chloroflexota bacterium]
MSRLQLVVVDVDGCLTPGEGQPWNFEALKYIAQLNQRAQEDPTKVAVTLCTGRQEPYVEVLMQAIDAHLPGIYENGGGLYFPREYRFVENPLITAEMREALTGIKATLQREIVETGLGYFQPGKEVSLTLYPLHQVSVHKLYLAAVEVLATCNAGYMAQESVSCVDIIPRGVDKGAGVRWLSQETGVPLDQIGGIGDSPSDLRFLSIVGRSAAPANAADEVKAAVDYVSPHRDGDGVVDILCRWVEQ